MGVAGIVSVSAISQLHAATTTLTGTVRDFVSGSGQGATYNNDFENVIADDRGIVTSTLGSDGTPVYGNHPSGTATTHGAAQFDQWFHDTPGVNMNIPYAITLSDAGHAGTYTYSTSEFFPVDGQGFGNTPGQGHNYSFTYQIATKFNYSGSGAFTFTGDDDVWVYINDQLAIDLGGVHGPESASVDLSTLGLTAGQNYDLDVFFAERHTTGSNFRMDTTLALETRPTNVPDAGSTFALMSGACAFLGITRRKMKS
jgi:fibro-slime domain-containing protein